VSRILAGPEWAPRARVAAGVWSVAGNMLGALLPYVIVLAISDTAVTDAYFILSAILFFVAHLLAQSIEAVLVPYWVRTRLHARSTPGRLLLKRPVRQLLLLGVVGGLLGGGVATAWLTVSSSGVVAAHRSIWVALTALTALPVATVMSAALASGLHARGRFGLTNATRGLRSVVAIVLVIAGGDHLGVAAAGLGLVTGELIRAGLLAGAHQTLTTSGRDRAPKDASPTSNPSLWRWFVPHLLAGSVTWARPMADVALASWLSQGAVTVLVLAEKVYAAPLVLVTAAVCSVSGTLWSDQLERDCPPSEIVGDYRRTQRRMCRWLSLGCLVCCAVLPAVLLTGLGDALVGVGRSLDLTLTIGVLLVTVPFAASTRVATRLIVVVGRTSVLPRLGVAAIAANVLLSALLASALGVVGIALGTLGVRVGTAVIYHRVAVESAGRATAAGSLACVDGSGRGWR
jgi:peptidoglycan biosynthesis protein MviN/MurJ (putative lipid II flippase)